MKRIDGQAGQGQVSSCVAVRCSWAATGHGLGWLASGLAPPPPLSMAHPCLPGFRKPCARADNHDPFGTPLLRAGWQRAVWAESRKRSPTVGLHQSSPYHPPADEAVSHTMIPTRQCPGAPYACRNGNRWTSKNETGQIGTLRSKSSFAVKTARAYPSETTVGVKLVVPLTDQHLCFSPTSLNKPRKKFFLAYIFNA